MLKLALLPCVVPVVPVPVITSTMAAGMFGANDVPSVEGTTVETTGITSGGWEVDSPNLSFNVFSSSYSIPFNLSLSFKSKSINSFSDFCFRISVVCGCLEGGSFSWFLKAAISSYFFLINA